MTGKASRSKGYRGEAEVVDILRDRGWRVDRRGAGNAGDDLRLLDFPDWYVEVKRCESLRIPEWTAKCAKGGTPWLLIFRRSRERWKVVMDLEDFLNLVES